MKVTKFKHVIVCLANCLMVLLSPVAIHGANLPGVLIITPTTTNSSKAIRKVVGFSPSGLREVAEIRGHVIYGMDQTNIAIVQTRRNDQEKGCRLLIIDRGTFNVIVDLNVSGVTVGNMMRLTMEGLVVRSGESVVYCSVLDSQGIGVGEINWMTGATRRLKIGTDEESQGLAPVLVDVPDGFAGTCNRIAKNPVIVVSDSASKRATLRITSPVKGHFTLYSVPRLGLMEYSEGRHYRLTEEDFSTALISPPEFSTSEVDDNSKIFVRTDKEKAYLIWGENKRNKNSDPPLISEIVCFNVRSQGEVWRRPLEGKISARFQPNSSGEKIYFVDIGKGEIFYLEPESGKINSFVQAGIYGLGSWDGSEILDAN